VGIHVALATALWMFTIRLHLATAAVETGDSVAVQPGIAAYR
jgi:hypothetical protein